VRWERGKGEVESLRRVGEGVLGRRESLVWLAALQLAVALGLQLASLGLPGSAEAATQEAAKAETGAEVDIEWAYALPHELMSPFCPGLTLASCSSPQAGELRLWILSQAAAGASREEIEANLYGRFGDVLRSTPKAEGWGLWAYLVPILFFVIGGPVVVYIIRRLTGGSGGDGGSPTASGAPGASESRAAALVAAAGAAGSDAELERLVDQELGGS